MRDSKLIGLLVIFALISTVLMSPLFWSLVGAVLVAGAITKYIDYYNKNVWPNKYFTSEEFLEQKAKISEYVEDCNALNEHIGELKALDSIQSSNKGTAVQRTRAITTTAAKAGKMMSLRLPMLQNTVTNANNPLST